MNEYLHRLLGPGRPELTCEECFVELDRYVDLQLAAAGNELEACSACRHPRECLEADDCLGMAAHLEGCPACGEEYESLVVLRRSEP
jgi:hypothetical protein